MGKSQNNGSWENGDGHSRQPSLNVYFKVDASTVWPEIRHHKPTIICWNPSVNKQKSNVFSSLRLDLEVILPTPKSCYLNITKHLDDGVFQRKRRWFENSDKLYILVENSTRHSMSAPHRRGILKSKESYAPLILGPTERSQGTK